MKTLKEVAREHRFAVMQPEAVEARAIQADLAYNRCKQTALHRSDAQALQDQIMLQVLLRTVA